MAARNRPTSLRSTDPRLSYDPAGRIHSLINENGAQTHFAWDVLDRLAEERGFDERSRRYRYNGAGELVEIEEASAGQRRSTRLQRDPAGRPIARHLPQSESAPAQSERLRYNRAGQLTEAHNAHCSVSWQYDKAGRARSEAQQHADGWTWQLAHQRNGLGVIEASHHGDAPPVSWLTYGPGHLHGLRIGEHSLDFERDGLHRENRRAGAHWQVQRDYDATGRLAAWQLDGSRLAAGGAPGKRGVRSGLLPPGKLGRATQIFPDAIGRPVTLKNPLGHVTRTDRDRVTAVTGGQGSVVRYQYDANGNLLSFTDAKNHVTTWSYNARSRALTKTDALLKTERYAYDAAGNLAFLTDPKRPGQRLRIRLLDPAHQAADLASMRTSIWCVALLAAAFVPSTVA